MAKNYILGVDVGTGSIKVLAGLVDGSGDVAIKGAASLSAAGVSKGTIVNGRELAVTIKEAIECATSDSDLPHDSIYLGLGGMNISAANSIGSIAPASSEAITSEDVERACRTVAAATVAEDHQILHILPISYWLDGKRQIEEPLGYSANRLEVETHIVSIPRATVSALTDALAARGVYVAGVAANSIVGAEVLAKDNGEEAYLIIDIGAGAADVVLYNEGKICMSTAIPLGGDYITGDIMQGLGVGRIHAEEIKRYYARLDRHLRGQEVILDCTDNETTDKQISYDFLYNIVESRVEEIVAMLYEYLGPALSRYPVSKILLTGGCSMMPSIAENVDRVFGTSVSLAKPGGLPPEYSHPANTVSYGLLRYAAGFSPVEQASGSTWRSLFNKIKNHIGISGE